MKSICSMRKRVLSKILVITLLFTTAFIPLNVKAESSAAVDAIKTYMNMAAERENNWNHGDPIWYFALYDMNGDGVDEFIAYGGGQMNYLNFPH